MNPCFITRSPLLAPDESIFAYEVLFRNINDVKPDHGPGLSPGEALALFLSMNEFTQLAGEKTVVLRLGPHILKDDIIALVPKDRAVLEISDEDAEVASNLLERCTNLQKQGYRFCLRDFKQDEFFFPFLQLADFIQIRVAGEDRGVVAEQMGLVKRLPAKLIASSVWSRDDFEYCLNLGFHLFKGSFYYRPTAMSAKSISPSQMLLLELSSHLGRDADIHIVEGTFRKNPDLAYGLLKLINSAFFHVQQRVTSIRQAIALLGYENLRKWVALLLFTVDHRDHTLNPLVEKTLVRGRMMEMLAERVTGSKTIADSAFITGILAFINALFGVALSEIVDKLNLAAEIQEALLNREGLLGTLLAITEDLDNDNFEEVEREVSSVGLRINELYSIETKAILEYQASVNEDQRRSTQRKGAP